MSHALRCLTGRCVKPQQLYVPHSVDFAHTHTHSLHCLAKPARQCRKCLQNRHSGGHKVRRETTHACTLSPPTSMTDARPVAKLVEGRSSQYASVNHDCHDNGNPSGDYGYAGGTTWSNPSSPCPSPRRQFKPAEVI